MFKRLMMIQCVCSIWWWCYLLILCDDACQSVRSRDLTDVSITFYDVSILPSVSMGVSTVKTNRDRDRDFSTCQDELKKTVEIWIETFGSGHWCQDEIEKSQSILIEISRLSRQTFWKSQDFLNCRDKLFDNVEIETLNQNHVETNRDPQA